MTVNIAPDPENLQVGKGIVSFKPDGAADFIDLGNCPEIEYEPTIERLDHFTSRAGIRTKDKSVVIERGGSLRILMEEITAFNLSMLMMGTIGNDGPDGEPSVDIFTADTLRGELKYVKRPTTSARGGICTSTMSNSRRPVRSIRFRMNGTTSK